MNIETVSLRPESLSLISMIDAVYEAISGKKGEPRNWEMLADLCHPLARWNIIEHNDRGRDNISFLTLEDFKKSYVEILGNEEPAFLEYQVDCKIDKCGNVIHVFSTYESRYYSEKLPFKRGVNSFQIFNDGSRFWIINVFWDRTYNEMES